MGYMGIMENRMEATKRDETLAEVDGLSGGRTCRRCRELTAAQHGFV